MNEPQVDRLVLQANRAKLADKYEKRLKKIARLAKRICERPVFMNGEDIDDLCELRKIAEQKP